MKAPMSKEMKELFSKPGNGHEFLIQYLEKRKNPDEDGTVEIELEGETFRIAGVSNLERANLEDEKQKSWWDKFKDMI